ncbi:response regulator transcription factor [Aeoliella sp. ICT_H6.2]|uniref:Response regulator transcription factor n=1 Tax=Aeoliella straminimaris TaxID=2954799 RepID=A0A9X2JJU8_9BACT|nr:response regulator transcription factor [Aeoliella straminimaris]MCO6045419.1 response regulator transcription factor [Aeoliella straminimaris]
MAIKVLVVDDHPVVRIGVKQLTSGTDIHVVAEAENGAEAIESTKKMQIDLVLLDVRMPEVDGLRCLAEIRKLKPQLPVLMFSAYDSPTYIARAVALGASGYLTKSVKRDALIGAITEVAGGGTAWSRDDLRRASGPVGDPDTEIDLEVPLTRREMEVLKQLAFGLTNKEIAEALGISYETVKEHVQHVLRKLGVSDRTQAAVWAVRKGLA